MERPTVLVTDHVDGPAVRRLASFCRVVPFPEPHRDLAAFKTLLREADALIVRNQTVVDAEVVRYAPRLRVIGRAGTGLDNIDLAAAQERGIVVTFAPGSNATSVAELTMGLMIALARSVLPADRSTRQGRWERSRFVGRELCGKTLGLIGFGQVGCRVAARARAFGMNVCVYDPYFAGRERPDAGYGVEWVSLDALYARAEIISVHAPLTPQTRKMIDREAWAKMRDGVLLINTSRGPIVDEPALIEALESGKAAGAALDVRETEPPVAGKLESFSNVILTPHIAGFTHEALERVTEEVVADVERVLRGGQALHAVGRVPPRTKMSRTESPGPETTDTDAPGTDKRAGHKCAGSKHAGAASPAAASRLREGGRTDVGIP